MLKISLFILKNYKATKRQDQKIGKQSSILANTWTHYSSSGKNELCEQKQLDKELVSS